MCYFQGSHSHWWANAFHRRCPLSKPEIFSSPSLLLRLLESNPSNSATQHNTSLFSLPLSSHIRFETSNNTVPRNRPFTLVRVIHSQQSIADREPTRDIQSRIRDRGVNIPFLDQPQSSASPSRISYRHHQASNRFTLIRRSASNLTATEHT